MRDIILLGMAREESTRLPNKMLRPFGDTTLFDIHYNLLREIAMMENSPFSKVVLAINKKDKNLWNKAYWSIYHSNSSVVLEERNDWSVQGATKPSELFHYLGEYEEDYVFRLNACFPFLTTETIIKAANFFKSHPKIKTMTCVRERANWFWEPKTGKSLTLGDPTHTTMQQSKMLYESVHCFHILNRQSLLNDVLWNLNRNDPYLYVLPESVEFIDIDTETEFTIAESVWRNKK